LKITKKMSETPVKKTNLMKNTILHQILLVSLIIISLFLTGCQDELNEITVGTEEEETAVLTVNSPVALLMKSTVTKDGSFDNILDNASCFNIQLPVNVFVNDLEIIIDSEEDFMTIENLFDEYYNDEDYLEYVFPIVIVLADYEEVTIQNNDQLEEYIDLCENSEDDDIECLDFKYPMFYAVFNTSENKIKTVEIQSDREMYRFLKRIDTNEIVSINFPLTLIYTDGEELIVQNMDGLENALEEGSEFCDEDDDNDYNEDDFDLERLNKLLVKCPWIVRDLIRNKKSLTYEYAEYLIVFQNENIVKVRRKNGEIITGEWRTEMTDRGVVISLEFENGKLQDFTLTWKVADINHDRIKLYSTIQGRIILEKKCDIIFEHTNERIANILTECLWRVAKLNVNGEDKVRVFIGTPLKFFKNGVAKLRINGELIEGEWNLTETTLGKGYVLEIIFHNYPDLNLNWQIRLLKENRIKLVNDSGEMILHKTCPQEYEDVTYINNTIVQGIWAVTKYETQNGNLTGNFKDYVINFNQSGKIFAEGDGKNIFGSWISYRYENLKLALNFDQYPLSQFNHRWKVYEISDTRIKLVDFSSTGSIERILVLEKT
jgi:hypothetical protein